MAVRKKGLFKQQMILFIGIFLGYALYCYNRKSGFTYVTPYAMQEDNLSVEEIGLVATCHSIAYIFGNFGGGMLAERYSARSLFSLGLVLVSLCMAAFSAVTSVVLWSGLQFLNGLAQGLGWPCCVVFLRKWFPAHSLATWWSILSAGMNVAPALGVPLASGLAGAYGWRAAVFLPAMGSIVFAGLAFLVLRDSPKDLGYTGFIAAADSEGDDKTNQKKKGNKLTDAFSYPYLLSPCLVYCGLVMAKTVLTDWLQLFLLQDRGRSQDQVNMFVSASEVGGIVGSVLAGYLADYFLKHPARWMRHNARCELMAPFCLLAFLCLRLLHATTDAHSSQELLLFLGLCLGAVLYGGICVVGVAAIESVPPSLGGTANTLAALTANLGQVSAGLPIAALASSVGWGGVVLSMEGVCLSILVVALVTRSYSPRLAKKID